MIGNKYSSVSLNFLYDCSSIFKYCAFFSICCILTSIVFKTWSYIVDNSFVFSNPSIIFCNLSYIFGIFFSDSIFINDTIVSCSVFCINASINDWNVSLLLEFYLHSLKNVSYIFDSSDDIDGIVIDLYYDVDDDCVSIFTVSVSSTIDAIINLCGYEYIFIVSLAVVLVVGFYVDIYTFVIVFNTNWSIFVGNKKCPIILHVYYIHHINISLTTGSLHIYLYL